MSWELCWDEKTQSYVWKWHFKKLLTKYFGCPEGWFSRVWKFKWYPDDLPAKIMECIMKYTTAVQLNVCVDDLPYCIRDPSIWPVCPHHRSIDTAAEGWPPHHAQCSHGPSATTSECHSPSPKSESNMENEKASSVKSKVWQYHIQRQCSLGPSGTTSKCHSPSPKS